MPAQHRHHPAQGPHRLPTAAVPDGPLRHALHEAMQFWQQAEDHGHPLVRCQGLQGLAHSLMEARALDAAEACLVLALHEVQAWPGSHDLQADLLCALADLCCSAADAWDAALAPPDGPADGLPKATPDRTHTAHDDLDPPAQPPHARRNPARGRAHHWALEAARLARQVSDPHWQLRVLRHAARVLERGGAFDDAVHLERLALALEQPARPSRWARVDPALRHAAPRQPM